MHRSVNSADFPLPSGAGIVNKSPGGSEWGIEAHPLRNSAEGLVIFYSIGFCIGMGLPVTESAMSERKTK